jgi:phosphatidylglycerophosphatase A
MTPNQKNKPNLIVVLFLSWFFSGKSPKAPGTIGSLATIPLILLLHYLDFNHYTLFTLIFVLYIISVSLTQSIQKKFELHDPQWIVIDEVIGMLITWSFTLRVDPAGLFWVFVFFRVFDIIKIWPASYFDKLDHGIGTITDDVISGVYAGILTLLIGKIA